MKDFFYCSKIPSITFLLDSFNLVFIYYIHSAIGLTSADEKRTKSLRAASKCKYSLIF